MANYRKAENLKIGDQIRWITGHFTEIVSIEYNHHYNAHKYGLADGNYVTINNDHQVEVRYARVRETK